MNNATKVTWLLPVRNGMPFLPETLASIEAQTYKDWEVLAWDNGSTDGTVEVLKEWIPSRLPGKVITDQPAGLGASLALMVNVVDTEFCARIDADDVNLPQRLEKQIAFLTAHPEIAAVGAQATRIDAGGQATHIDAYGIDHGPFITCPTRHDDIVHCMLVRNPMIHPATTFRRSAILEAGNYRDVGSINIEDYDLWMRLATKHKLANLEDYLLKYRVHDKSTTSWAMAENRLQDAVLVRFVEHAPLLFGCSAAEAKLLRTSQHPSALKPLRVIARHLKKTQGGDRMHSESFLTSARRLTRKNDYFTRLFLSYTLHGWRTLAAKVTARFGRVFQRSEPRFERSTVPVPSEPGNSAR